MQHMPGWILACLVLVSAPAAGARHVLPPRGSVAPTISLPSVDGDQVSTTRFEGRALVIIFGELDHVGAQRACAVTLDVLEDRRIPRDKVVPLMVIAEDSPRTELKERALGGRFPSLILHDPGRGAFGDYRVLVLPSVVVVGTDGKIVYAAPGFVPRFKELLAESILVGTGRESMAQFERSLAQDAEEDPVLLRVERLLHLGRELERHGLGEMAEARYLEAIELRPDHAPSRLVYGRMLMRDDRLDDAESQFREVLSAAPVSEEAILALAELQIVRGGDELVQAEKALDGVMERNPQRADAHYLMGMIYETRGELVAAAGAYRRAAELLLGR